MWLIILSLSVSAVLGKSVPQEKGAPNSKFYNLLSTMTPYDDVRGKIQKIEGCEAVGLWGFVRHATRYPHDYQVHKYANMTTLRDEILQNHQEGRGSLSDPVIEKLRRWHLVADLNQNMLLTASGIEELRKMGERIGKNFPKLFKGYYDGDVDIRITTKERTRQSAESFVTGLYGRHMKIDNHNIYDDLIKNEKNCPAWKNSTKSDKLKEEKKKFQNSAEMAEVFESVGKRLGLQRNLTFDEVQDMYDLCGFEYAWYHSLMDAPWCSVFTDRDLQIMEYSEDVSYYYKSAFGNPLTPKLGCAYVKDIIERLSSDSPKSTLYFGHSMGNRKLLTALRIGEERQPLSGSGFAKSAKRKWRTSYLTPFAANLIAVKYKCKKGSEKKGMSERERVAVFVNEKLTRVPACGGKDMCGLEEFKRVFASLVDPSYCNRDFCGTQPVARRGQLPLDDDDDDDDDS